MISNMQAVSVGPTLISISATGVNVQPQALNVSPDLIVVGPYDTTIAGQVVSFCHSCAFTPRSEHLLPYALANSCSGRYVQA